MVPVPGRPLVPPPTLAKGATTGCPNGWRTHAQQGDIPPASACLATPHAIPRNNVFQWDVSESLTTTTKNLNLKSLRQGCTLLATYKCTLGLFGCGSNSVGGKRKLSVGGR